MRAGAREKREGWDTQHLMGWVGRAKDWGGGRVLSLQLSNISLMQEMFSRELLNYELQGKIFETLRPKWAFFIVIYWYTFFMLFTDDCLSFFHKQEKVIINKLLYTCACNPHLVLGLQHYNILWKNAFVSLNP